MAQKVVLDVSSFLCLRRYMILTVNMISCDLDNCVDSVRTHIIGGIFICYIFKNL